MSTILAFVPARHRVVALVVPGVLLLDLAAPAQIFDHLSRGRYDFELAGLRKGPVATSTGITVTAKRGLVALRDADTVVVPGWAGWPADRPRPLTGAASRPGRGDPGPAGHHPPFGQ
jgi:AraC family transcriptional regulator, transcriptional activator FtrA